MSEVALGLEHVVAVLTGLALGGGTVVVARLRRAGKAALVSAVEALADHEQVLAQVTPNGGETDCLGDRVVRIETRLAEGERRMDRIDRKLDRVAKDTATVAAWVTAGER